jgi:hypothetical protein
VVGNKILNGGIPDFSAFKISSYSQLIKHGIIEKEKGILINKIPVLSNFKKITTDTKVIDINSNYELILGEVKSDSSSLDQAINQMKKYSDVELSNKIYSIIPNCIDNKTKIFGNIYIHGNLLKVNESDIELKLNSTSQKKDNQWLETVIKLNLLGNTDFEELNNIICIQYKLKDKKFKSYHLMDFAQNHSIEEIIKDIENGLYIGLKNEKYKDVINKYVMFGRKFEIMLLVM